MEPVIIPRSEHPISRKLIDADAVKVLYRLHRAGYQAYLVGGGVRDLLLSRSPKDFDISTDAHPQQVKRLFRNCRLIGRRFRLAHVHFGGKIVEVSTFRRRSDPPEDGEAEDILIRSDNTFGNAEEDALRRDFTINGLFYDIGTFSVIDYVGGLDDLRQRTIRTIGEPDIRFREDPVRMIRAVKFAARLGFEIEPDTWRAILENREEILKSAPPRVLEEMYRLLGGGAAEASFRLLHDSGLLDILAPQVAAHIEEQGGPEAGPAGSLIRGWLGTLDRLRAGDAPLTNALLMGALVAPLTFDPASTADNPETWRLSDDDEDRVREVLADLGVPRRDTERLFQMFRGLRRFSGQKGRRFSPRAFVLKNYFAEAFLFYRMGLMATGQSEEPIEKWQALAEDAGVDGMAPPTRRRRRRRRRRGGEPGSGEFREPFEEGLPSEEAAELESLAIERDHDFDDELEDEFEDEEGPLDEELRDEDEAEAPAVTGSRREEAPVRRSGERTGRHPGEGRREPDPRRHPRGPREHGPREHAPREPGPRREPAPRREPDFNRDTPPPRPAPPAPAARARHEDDDEDSQIKFLGWADQPEILRDRPQPPPLVNPYTRDQGGARRGGGWRGRPEGSRSGGPRPDGSRGHHRSGPGSPGGRGRPGGGPAGQGGGPSGHSGGGRPAGAAGGANRRGRRRPKRRD